MAFERFIKTGRVYRPTASLWSRGQLGFNRGAIQKYNISDYSHAVLFYDKENNRIGIKFITDGSESGAVQLTKGKTGAFISAKAFLDFYDINHDKTRKFPLEYNKEEGLFIISLRREMAGNEE